MSGHHGTWSGTIGGTLCCILAGVQTGDVVKTILLAFVGALTSFTCSYVLKAGVGWIRQKFRK